MADPNMVEAILRHYQGIVAPDGNTSDNPTFSTRESLLASPAAKQVERALDAGWSEQTILSFLSPSPNSPGGAATLKAAVDAIWQEPQQQQVLNTSTGTTSMQYPSGFNLNTGSGTSQGAPAPTSNIKNIVDSYLDRGYTKQPDAPNILFKWIDDPVNGSKMDIVDVSRLYGGAGGSGSGSGGGGAGISIVRNQQTGRALKIDSQGNVIGEVPELYEPPDAKAPDLWQNPDNGNVFSWNKDSKSFELNPTLSSAKQPGLVINTSTGKAFSWDSKTGQWTGAPQFDTNPEISPQAKFDFQRQQEDNANARYGAGLAEQQRGNDLQTATTLRGQDFNLAPQLANFALNAANYDKQVLTQGSDYISRAFKQRGGTSPYPFVSNADLINTLRTNTAASNDFLRQLAAERPTFNLTRTPFNVAPVSAAPTPVASPPQDSTPGYVATPGGGIDLSASEILNGAQWRPTPGFALGTKGTKARQFMVGDPMPHMPDDPNPEVVTVHKPGPDTTIEVEPMKGMKKGMPKFALGTDSAGYWGPYQQGGNAWYSADGSMVDANATPDVNPGSPRFGYKSNWIPLTSKNTTPYTPPGATPSQSNPFGASMNMAPQIPTSSPVSQADLIAAAKEGAGPAITNLFNGSSPPPLQFDFALPTLRNLSLLTDEEKQALNSYLGVVYNSSLNDVYTAANQQQGRTGTGFGARQSGFVLN